MADALCGPSNPLQNFQKHTAADRTLQQDRLTARPLPSQGFRSSSGANAGILDAEFEAFQAGFPTASHLPDPQLFHHTRQTPYTNSASTSSFAPGWASDFQRLNITSKQLPTPQYHFGAQPSLQRSAEQNGLTNGQRTAGWTPIQQKADETQRFDAQLGIPRYTNYQQSMPEWYQTPGPASSTTQYHQPQAQVEDVFDEAAFERAFEAARSDVQGREEQRQQEKLELGNDVLINESAGRLLQSDHLAEQELIGADAILQEAQDQPQEHQQTDDPDELARTAGQLLDSVKYEQNQKFQESSFLALMRRLRDREVRVEGDKMVDATQPLHPGGDHYPGDMDTTMSGAIPIEDNSPTESSAIILSASRDPSAGSSFAVALTQSHSSRPKEDEDSYTDLPRHSPVLFAPSSSSSTPPSPRPPPFSSLYFPQPDTVHHFKPSITDTDSATLTAFAPAPPFEPSNETQVVVPSAAEAETKAALPADTKGDASGKSADDGEPPPPYTEGSSPLDSFTYVMAAAGGAASIITQVQQGGGPPINTLGDVGADEHITLDLRGTRFTLSRDELLTLPEFVLLSLFPNGLLPDGHMNSFHEGDIYPVDYDPASLQYMLDFFRNVAQTIPTDSPTASPDDTVPIEPVPGSARDMLQDRAGIIVLREDLDFYAIPPRADIEQPEMIEVKRAAGRALLKQDGIFSGLRRSEESGTTEQHLIEMLTAGGFNNDDQWGHRASEPNKAVICSLALARLRTDIKGNDLANSNALGMAQKLLLFWRKPARRCWWEGVELENVDGVEGRLKVWIRRVWTLEMSVIGLR